MINEAAPRWHWETGRRAVRDDRADGAGLDSPRHAGGGSRWRVSTACVERVLQIRGLSAEMEDEGYAAGASDLSWLADENDRPIVQTAIAAYLGHARSS